MIHKANRYQLKQLPVQHVWSYLRHKAAFQILNTVKRATTPGRSNQYIIYQLIKLIN